MAGDNHLLRLENSSVFSYGHPILNIADVLRQAEKDIRPVLDLLSL